MALPVRAFLDGFLDGFTAAGSIGKLRLPGAPTEFVDSRSVEEFVSSGEFAAIASRFSANVPENKSNYPLHSPVKSVSELRVKPIPGGR